MEVLDYSGIILLIICVSSTISLEFEELLGFSPCSEPCGTKGISSVMFTCDDPQKINPCGSIEAKCNQRICQEYPVFSECSSPCGGGTRTRMFNGSQEVQLCNSFRCGTEVVESCPFNLLLMFDISSSVDEYKFQYAKQMAIDIVKLLPSADIRIGLISFSVTAMEQYHFDENMDSETTIFNINSLYYTGGSTYPPSGIASTVVHFESLDINRFFLPRILVTFTDSSGIRPAQTNDFLNVIRSQYDVITYAMNLGSNEEVKVFGQQPYDEFVFQANKDDDHLKMLSSILMHTCQTEHSFTTTKSVDQENERHSILTRMNSLMPLVCEEWSEWTPCQGECNQRGITTRYLACGPHYGESTKEFEYDFCTVVCTTPSTTTTPNPDTIENWDCERCNFTMGQIWLENNEDCNKFFICEKIVNSTGAIHYRKYSMTCGASFWHQDTLSCESSLPFPMNCVVNDPDAEEKTANYTKECPYMVLPDAQYYTLVTLNSSTNSLTQRSNCGVGFRFNDTLCTCIQFFETDCTSDPLLHFPFDQHYNDVSCNRAKGILRGPGNTSIVFDPVLGKNVAEFDGGVKVEVAFMRNWLQNQNITQWSIRFLFMRLKGESSVVSFVNNGDCVDGPSFEVQGHTEVNGGQSVSYSVRTDVAEVTTNNSPVGGFDSTWHQVLTTYDGHVISVYIDGHLVNQAPQTSAILNTQNPMNIAMCGCHEFQGAGLNGRMSELKIYTRVVSV